MVIGVDASRANCDQLTGTERYAFEVIRRLPVLCPDFVWRLYVREPLHKRWGQLPGNVEVRVLSWPPKFLWTHLRLACEVFLRRPAALFVPVGALPFWLWVKSVTTIHDVAFERYPELYRTPLIKGLLGRWLRVNQLSYQRWVIRRALQANAILVVSQFSKGECEELYGAVVSRMTVTPLGVDDDEWRRDGALPSAVWLREKYSLTRPYLLFVGRLETKKNIDGILRSYRAWQEQNPDRLDLVLIGSAGEGWDQHCRLVPDDWFGRSVHVLGFVAGDDRVLLQRGAFAVLFVSRHEGFGLVPLEAMAVGVPVIAANATAIPEVVGNAALLVNPERTAEITAAISALWQDRQLRASFIERGFSRAKLFSWDETARRTAAVITDVVGLQAGRKNGTVEAA